MATGEIYLKVSGRYYPCEPKKAWLRKHLPTMLWVWWFERKLIGAKWGLFISWNLTWPITIHRMKVMQISKDELLWAEWRATWDAAYEIGKQTKGVEDGE